MAGADPKLTEKARAFLDSHPELKFVDVFLSDMNGVLRGKRLPAKQALGVFESGLRLPRSLIGVDIWGYDVMANGLVLETGDVDGLCFPAGTGILPCPWSGGEAAQILLMMGDEDGGAFHADPRQLLIDMKERLAKAGLYPVAALELEFFLLSRKSDEYGRPLTPARNALRRRIGDARMYAMNELDDFGRFFRDVYAACEEQGLPLGAAIVEGGAGQFEVNLMHQADVVAAADQAVLFRRTVKCIADQHELIATFMAKPFGEIAGNGLHVHMSMLNDRGENVFAGDDDNGSPVLMNAVAGLLAAAPEAMIFLAPHMNSYRRFQDASHAPTSLTWGYENRTAAIRIPNDGPENRRFEFRIAGADANPYLLLAALLGGVLHGIENKLTPPPATEGNAYEADAPRVPIVWSEATDVFADGDILAPYFGELFTRVFTALKRQEMQKASERVTDFEYDSYLQAF
ncbi:glutamine synthetase family protein [Hyphococcus sp.]|jgi:glutamine synthetase|uniref:glutamine synthetase family protein n=1 Tax=Hyphococcus sp. TaxID=2038636 RepID=UPI003D0F8300